jgi:hypothetical protein
MITANLPGWNAADLGVRIDWRLSFASVPGMDRDLARLAHWRANTKSPITQLSSRSISLPAIDHFAARVAERVHGNPGLAWIRDVPQISDDLLSLLYLAIGLRLGRPLDVYGRLYDVIDRGGSYRTQAIPVSQTKSRTGVHTDSSNLKTWPSTIGLVCIRPSVSGGASRIVSAERVYALLRASSPQHCRVLGEDFIRDVVTPGSDRGLDAVRNNAFPIFSGQDDVRFRYMRFWIERGHQRAGVPLSHAQIAALDALDSLLEDTSLQFGFRLEARQMLFLDNTRVAHDRDSYQDTPAQPRHLQRLWLQRPTAGTPVN